MLSAGAYIAGTLEVLVFAAAIAATAHRVRAAALPAWTGAPARLVEGIAGVALVVWLCEVLGSAQILGEWELLGGTPDRAIDHPRGQSRLLSRPRLATEEGAGDLARGVVLLLHVDGQRKEVNVALVAGGGGAEDHGVAGANDHGATRLSGELPGLE